MADEPGNEPPAEGPASDHALVVRVLDGDEQAARLLLNRYDRLVRFTIFRAARQYCTRDPGWLDARANEAWTGIFQSLRRTGHRQIPPNLSAYFIQIARNKCLDAVRKAAVRPIIPFDEAQHGYQAADELIDCDSNPSLLLENLEQIEALRGCLAELSEDDRLICSEIAAIGEKRWSEAADRLGMAESTFRSRWKVVQERLRRCLEKKIKKSFAPPDIGPDS